MTIPGRSLVIVIIANGFIGYTAGHAVGSRIWKKLAHDWEQTSDKWAQNAKNCVSLLQHTEGANSPAISSTNGDVGHQRGGKMIDKLTIVFLCAIAVFSQLGIRKAGSPAYTTPIIVLVIAVAVITVVRLIAEARK